MSLPGEGQDGGEHGDHADYRQHDQILQPRGGVQDFRGLE
jgi:hypothetical protein